MGLMGWWDQKGGVGLVGVGWVWSCGGNGHIDGKDLTEGVGLVGGVDQLGWESQDRGVGFVGHEPSGWERP